MGMSSTPLLPTACHQCHRTWLAAPTFELPAACPACQAHAEVVPGESYRADDLPLFERIEAAVFGAQLSERSSYRIWATLSDVSERWRRPDRLLRPLIDAIPVLQFLTDEFSKDRTQLARAVGMSLAALTTRLRAVEAQRQATATAQPPAGAS